MIDFKLEELEALQRCQNDDNANWLKNAYASVDYLIANRDSNMVIIYASGDAVYVHGVLASSPKIDIRKIRSLHSNFPRSEDCWTIQYECFQKESKVYLDGPLAARGDASLDGGEKLIYRRNFYGVKRDPEPIEISQKLVHSLGLHFMPERSAYCRLDQDGDFTDVIKVVYSKPRRDGGQLMVVTVMRSELDRFMAVSQTTLVLNFDFTRIPRGFTGWGSLESHTVENEDLLCETGGDGLCSYAHGLMVVHPRIGIDDLVRERESELKGCGRKYATFKIHDRKNNIHVEASCGPDHLSNYFENSNLPWEISPAFFKPAVLHLFKSDPDKYTLDDRSISCRGAWELRTFDINEAGQVHTYIGYLADLPYDVQLYWKSFNEWPKAGISDRANQTDMLGEVWRSYDPLGALKHAVKTLDESPPDWWSPRGEDVSSAARCPVTDSPKEWADEILALDQLLVEGFLIKPLRAMLEALGSKADVQWGSLKLLLEYLISKGIAEDGAKELLAPMQIVHRLRSEIKGHAAIDRRKSAEFEARKAHGTLRAHYLHMAELCEKSFTRIVDILLSGKS